MQTFLLFFFWELEIHAPIQNSLSTALRYLVLEFIFIFFAFSWYGIIVLFTCSSLCKYMLEKKREKNI